MGTFDESFLEVPISRNGKINYILTAERIGDRVFFKIKNEKNSNDFFNLLVFKERNQLKGKIISGNENEAFSKSNCYTVQVTWTWTSETTGQVLQVDTFNETRCKPSGPVLTEPTTPGDCLEENCTGGGTGGGGYPYTPEQKDPCETTKELLQNNDVKNVVTNLKEHMASGQGGEKGWRLNKTGAPSQTTQNSAHRVSFGDPSTMNGGYHNHTGTGVNIFSATDISTLIEIVRYQSIGSTGNGYMGVVAPNGIHYVIYFNGSHADLPISGSYSDAQLKYFDNMQWKDYLEIVHDNNLSTSQKLESIFFSTLDRMGLKDKLILQRIEDNKVLTIAQNSQGHLGSSPCHN
ncbi:hypothetical protein SAMN05421594_1442 [Chryseobacterium oleae]|uniref:Uncharacterized protein n=1 Tax=Chryseobacterium oleae TaxID=491207 RepID=A0A1I4WS92_CHROL|nr:hypothetical protein [Chryseobacterium oleae]SFN15859.1 hypothetical protein SAMN05421594_1442 [Chryseobacterium oleae]